MPRPAVAEKRSSIFANKKAPETSRGFGALVFRGLCRRLHTTSDPETSGAKVKVPIIDVQPIHYLYFRPPAAKSKRKNAAPLALWERGRG